MSNKMSSEQKLLLAFQTLLKVQTALANHRDKKPIEGGSLEEFKYTVVDETVNALLRD